MKDGQKYRRVHGSLRRASTKTTDVYIDDGVDDDDDYVELSVAVKDKFSDGTSK